jgi:curli biogenesis system outer membrane secretion channel CsgG
LPSRPLAGAAAALLLCAAATLSCAGAGGRPRGGEPFPLPKGSPVLVLGLSKDFEQEGWEDEAIGWGLGTCLAEALYSTGLFKLVEAKPEVAAEIRAAQARAWATGAVLAGEAARIAPLQDARYLAYGRVVAAGAPRSSASLGILHARSRSTLIDVEITIEDVRTRRTLTAPGRGSAVRAAGSAVFDLRGKEVALDKSTIGKATQEAIRNAVRALADGIVVTESISP